MDLSKMVQNGMSLPCAMAVTAIINTGASVDMIGKTVVVYTEKAQGWTEFADMIRHGCDRVVFVESQKKLNKLSKSVLSSVAWHFFAMWWINDQEHRGRWWPSGADLLSLAPKRTPRDARLLAEKFGVEFEKKNGASLPLMYLIAEASDPGHVTVDEFASTVVLMAIGSGVDWTDNHPDIGMKSPYMEYYP